MKPKYLADENIPLKIVEELKEEGYPIESIPAKQWGMQDKNVIKYAFQKKLIILTFDKDFGQLVFKEKLQVIGIVLLRFPPTSPLRIKSLLREILDDEDFNPLGKFVVVHETHMRIVELP
ncbi:MAG TPA: DUF5615 family PIN-like protein [candidate division Zixibacteria bacterium]|nr:DUF5615 family PIN-like protein [candidate division Zixibacteria bacterium]